MDSDHALLSAWHGGDDTAGRRLFERHFDRVARFFANKVDTDAEDLVQATFLACAESSARFEGRASFATFLLGIAHKVLLKHLRRRYGRGHTLDLGQVSLRDLCASPSSMVARNIEQQRLLDALRTLPVHEQVVVELYYWENLSAAELGRLLEVPEGTVRTRLRSARQRLERRLRRSLPMLAPRLAS